MNGGLFIFILALALTLTRTIYPKWVGLIEFTAPIGFTLAVAATTWFSFPIPYGPLLAVCVVVASAWFAWSARVPLFFKQWSWERLVGEKNYRAEDVPNTVWARPKFIASWWPTWL